MNLKGNITLLLFMTLKKSQIWTNFEMYLQQQSKNQEPQFWARRSTYLVMVDSPAYGFCRRVTVPFILISSKTAFLSTSFRAEKDAT
jgi:hypothetical protein